MAGNFQHMAGAGGNQMMQQQQPQQGRPGQDLQQWLILQIQQQGGHLTGWQANVGYAERFNQVWHMASQLRLVNTSQQDLPKICGMALSFEKSTFDSSPDKETYLKTLQDKLAQLTVARGQLGVNAQAQLQAQVQQAQAQRQAAAQAQAQAAAQAAQAQAQIQAQAQQINMANQVGLPGHMQRNVMGQQQQPFHHLQHQMQASPLPGQQQQLQQPQPQPQSSQQQVAMGLVNHTLPQNMGAPPQQGQLQPQQQFMTMQQQQQQQQQMPQNNRQQVGPNGLTPQEMVRVNELAQKMMQSSSEEEKAHLRQNITGKIDPATLQRCQTQGIDPLVLLFRNQTLSRYKQEKMRAMRNQIAQSQGMQGNVNAPSAAPMQQQRSGNPGMVNGQGQGQGQQPPHMLANQGFDPYLGGVENLTGQQASVLPQDPGQLVTSTGGPQGSAAPQALQSLSAQQAGGNGQRPLSNPNLRTQQAQQAFNAQQSQAERINLSQSQAQIRANAQAKAQQQMALHGQPGGMGPMPPQQSPAMATLNAPLRTPQQSQQPNPLGASGASGTSQITQPSTTHFGQPLDARFSQVNNQQRNSQGGGMNTMALNGSIFPANMPPNQRQRLLTLPKDKLNEVLNKWNSTHQDQGQSQVAGKLQAAMPVSAQGARSNQPTPQVAPFNQQSVPNQFMNGAPNGQQQPQMMANMTPQQQMMLRQQMTRMPGQQGRPFSMSSGISPTEQQAVSQIDHIEFPQSLLANYNVLRQVPPEIKRWGELKQWASQNPPGQGQQGNMLEIVKNYQRMHYQQIMRARSVSRQQQPTGGLPNGPAIGQPQPTPMVTSGMAPVATMQPQMPASAVNMAGMQINPEDIQKARTHPSGKWASLSDDEIKQMIIKNTYIQRQRAMQQQHQMQLAQLAQLQQPQQPFQAPVQRTPQTQSQRPQNLNQTTKQIGRSQPGQTGTPQVNAQLQSTAPEPMIRNLSTGRPNKGQTKNQTSNSQIPKNNLKRSNSGDIVEISNPNNQPQPRPPTQQTANQLKPGQSHAQPTAKQLASLPPEQRKTYQALVRNQQLNMLRGNLNPDVQKCVKVFQEEALKGKLPLIPMTADVRLDTANKLTNAGKNFKKVRQALPGWFAITHDETRLRQFCQMYHKIEAQFKDQEMEQLKDSFSVNPSDVLQAYVLANNMMADVAKQYPNLSKSGAAINGATQPLKTPAKDAPLTQSVPLNAANLQQQQQALNQLNQSKSHNRSNSRNAPPAAPTSAHPPPFPVDLPNNLTQDQLRLPRNKKQKQSATSTPVINQQTPGSTTPQPIKASSPEIKAQQPVQPKEVEKVGFFCPERDCDHHFMDGFDNEEALERHREEEHIKPIRNPPQYVLAELATILGLEPDGTSKKAMNSVTQQGSIIGPHSTTKLENTPTAASVTPTDQQINGAKASPANSKSSKTSKPDEAKEAWQQSINSKGPESAKQLVMVEENSWAGSAVNPQDLQHNFQNLETGAGGAISDMNIYRSITPNDTPESSKDGISEPTSDISEGLDLSINLEIMDNDWHPFGIGEADDLLALGKINVNPEEEMGGMFDEDNSQYIPWNDFTDHSLLDKGFSFDNSMFSMNAD